MTPTGTWGWYWHQTSWTPSLSPPTIFNLEKNRASRRCIYIELYLIGKSVSCISASESGNSRPTYGHVLFLRRGPLDFDPHTHILIFWPALAANGIQSLVTLLKYLPVLTRKLTCTVNVALIKDLISASPSSIGAYSLQQSDKSSKNKRQQCYSPLQIWW